MRHQGYDNGCPTIIVEDEEPRCLEAGILVDPPY